MTTYRVLATNKLIPYNSFRTYFLSRMQPWLSIFFGQSLALCSLNLQWKQIVISASEAGGGVCFLFHQRAISKKMSLFPTFKTYYLRAKTFIFHFPSLSIPSAHDCVMSFFHDTYNIWHYQKNSVLTSLYVVSLALILYLPIPYNRPFFILYALPSLFPSHPSK